MWEAALQDRGTAGAAGIWGTEGGLGAALWGARAPEGRGPRAQNLPLVVVGGSLQAASGEETSGLRQ